jgi:hypothetical protein
MTRYRVTVFGSVSIKIQLSGSQEIETRKLAFCRRGEIDKSTLHRKPRKKYAEDGRLNAYGAGGHKSCSVRVAQCPLRSEAPNAARSEMTRTPSRYPTTAHSHSENSLSLM